MARKFSGFTDGLTNQSPTDTLVGLDLSLSAANQNSYWTLNSLFSVITRNITDGALRFQGFAAPAVSAAGSGSLYFDLSSNTFKISQNGGAYADIHTGVATVPQGGTGLSSLTAYAVLAGGTTSTGNVQQVSGLGTSGQVLTSNGAGALPTWQTVATGGISGAVSGNLIRANSTTTGTDSGIVSTEAANSVNSRYNVANYASLAAAVAAIGAVTQATLVIASSISVTASLTVTGNITLEFTNAGALNISAAQTVTIKGSLNAPLKQIFTGSGTATFTDNYRVAGFYPQWWGGIPDNLTNSTNACNAAILAAMSINGNGGGTIYFTGGHWLANLSIVVARGLSFIGVGREGTFIHNVGDNPIVQCNGLWYSRFEGISFQAASTITNAVFELDGNYDGLHTQGVQGNTFKDCTFHGQGVSTYGLAIARQGAGNAQGSENLFLDCHFTQFTFAAIYIGGANALQNTLVGGNIQAYGIYGIYCLLGSFNCFSVGFQYASATLRQQIEREGWDMYIPNSVDDHVTVEGCRSESFKFIYGSNAISLSVKNNSMIPPIQPWATSTAYAQGAIVKGITGGNGNGKIYIALVGGTSGGSEPVWPATNVVYSPTGATVSSGSFTPTLADPNGSAAGQGIIINGAGVAGAALYTTIASTSPVVTTDAASTSVSGTAYRFGAVVVDGSVTWMQYDYYVVQMQAAFADVMTNTFPYGRFVITTNRPITLVNNCFSRTDWLGQAGAGNFGGNQINNQLSFQGNRVTLNGGPSTGGAAQSYAVSVQNGGPAPIAYAAPFSIGGQALIWAGGAAGTNAADISVAPDFTNARLTCNSDLRGTFATKAGDPTTSDIAASTWAMYRNTSSGVLSLWANDGGVMKSVALT